MASTFFPTGQQWYTASSGTSHATPAVAGGAALLRQSFINQGLPPPSPAMTKAYLMNAARYMTGAGANDTLYSNNQGMGLLDLGKALDGAPRILRDEDPADLLTATGQTRTFSGVVADSSKPFRVTLAWTDAPGATFGSAWKNNLDLSVTVGGNTYLGNVFSGANSVTGGVADLSNNVESVFLPAGASGPFTVTVTAANINSDGVPGNASSLDQDFALVMSNACTSAPSAPTGLTATVVGLNRIDLAWAPNGGTEFNVYRSFTSGGPYTLLGSTASSSFSDLTVSGGSTYFYVVRSVACAESASSNEASATATGVCTLPPLFAGLTSATNGATSTCANDLAWAAATPRCGGAITYSVYRGTTSGFTPSIANRIATGVTGTGFMDDLNLTNGVSYYYVVHAVETAAATVEETNSVQKAAAPTGTTTTAINYFDDLDGNRPANASAYWIPTAISGPLGLNVVSGCHFQSASNAWKFGFNGCGGTYQVGQVNRLTLGGDGTTPGINGFVIPAGATGTMTFKLWYSFELQWDGAFLSYSTTGANGPYTAVPDTVTPGSPYITAGGYDSSLFSGGRGWTGSSTPANGALKAVSVNLDALAGKTVWFGFQFSSDPCCITYEGLYLDDVSLNVGQINACVTNVPPPGPGVSYVISGLPATIGAGVATSFNATALDAVGQIATGYNGSASFTSSDPQATLPPSTAFVGGVATAVPITFRSLGTRSVTASDIANPAITGSGSTTVTVGPPAGLAFQVQPTRAVAGVALAPSVAVRVVDAFGNPVSTSTASITLALGANPGGGTLSGTTTVAAVAGVATFPGLSIDKIGTGYTLVASASGLTGATSAGFDITPAAPRSLGITVQPGSTVAGAPISPGVQVAILDAFGNLTASTASVTMALGTNPSGGTLSGTTTVAAVAGVATFSNLWIDKVGSGYTLAAGSTGLTGATSAGFDITPAAPYSLSITGQPSNAVAGAPISPALQIAVLDRFSNVATNSSIPVVLSLGNNPYGGTLLGTRTVVAGGGVATFSNLAVDRAGTAYTLVAGSSGMQGATSVGFDVSAGAPARLAFSAQPSSATAGAPMAVAVAVQDGFGNTVTGASNVVTLALASPAGGTLSGTASIPAVDGVATFSGLSIDRAASGDTLVASAPGLGDATSAAFDITAGAPSGLELEVSPGNSVAGTDLSPTVRVAVKDGLGNTVTSSTASITLALGNNPSGGTLSGPTTVSAEAGVATFPDLSIDKAGAGYTLAASATGLTGATSASFDVTAGSPARLAFTRPPVNTTAGAALAPVVVALQDALGNTIAASTANVTLFLETNPAGGTLGGTRTVPATNGVATFSDLSITRAGTGYTLVANAPGFAEATSSTFDVSAGPVASYVLSGLPPSITAGVEATFSVSARDGYGNPISDYAGTAVVTSTDADAALPAPRSFVHGVLTGVRITFRTPGLDGVTVTDRDDARLTVTGTSNVTSFAQPTVTVTSPAEGDAVSGVVTLTATGAVAPGATLGQIDLLVDGTVIGTGTASPASVSWNTDSLSSNSRHTITAVVRDSAGNVASSVPVTVTVVRHGCGCGATGGADAGGALALVAAARTLLGWRRRFRKIPA